MFKKIANWFKKLGLRAKLIITGIAGFLAFTFYLVIQGKMNLKSSFKYELAKVKSDLEMKRLEKDSERNAAEIADLEAKEKQILEKIQFIEEKEGLGEEVFLEDLDRFFDERGF